MTTQTTPCYRRDCSADAGYRIQLLCGLERDVCWDHFSDWVLEIGCAGPEHAHVNYYAAFRRQLGLPELPDEDLLALVRMTRANGGYVFAEWEY